MSSIDFTLEKNTPLFNEPIILTIGTFDGVHMGHQVLIHAGKKAAKKEKALFVVLNFKTPPAWFFSMDLKKTLLMPLKERIQWLHHFGVDHVLLTEFNAKVASLTAYEFLRELKKQFSLSKVILGHDARIGSDQENNREKILHAAKKLGIIVEFISPYRIDGEVVSSTRVRTLIEDHHFKKAEQLLGHPLNW